MDIKKKKTYQFTSNFFEISIPHNCHSISNLHSPHTTNKIYYRNHWVLTKSEECDGVDVAVGLCVTGDWVGACREGGEGDIGCTCRMGGGGKEGMYE